MPLPERISLDTSLFGMNRLPHPYETRAVANELMGYPAALAFPHNIFLFTKSNAFCRSQFHSTCMVPGSEISCRTTDLQMASVVRRPGAMFTLGLVASVVCRPGAMFTLGLVDAHVANHSCTLGRLALEYTLNIDLYHMMGRTLPRHSG